MSQEPLFGAYLKSREDTPASVDEMYEDDFEFEKVPADEVIRGWDNLEEFLQNSDEEYYWKEAEPETASEKVICEECNLTKRTHSYERVMHLRSMHHLSTGH